jgi:hypothetical protein
MPEATYPSAWDIQLKAVLQQKIASVVRKKVPEVRIRKEDVLLLAERFLRLYRENLKKSDPIMNLSVPSIAHPGPLRGYSAAEAKTKPLLGAIGIPKGRAGLQYGLIEKIRIGQYARLTSIRTGGRAQGGGILEFDFGAFQQDDLARYHDGKRAISWVYLIEYGFDVPGHLYLPGRHHPSSRSGFGIMRKSTRYDFGFGATHVFEDVFNFTKNMLTPRERLLLAINFQE